MATLRERFDRIRSSCMNDYNDYNRWRTLQIYDQAVAEQKRSIGNSVEAIEKRSELHVRVDVWIESQLKKAKKDLTKYD